MKRSAFPIPLVAVFLAAESVLYLLFLGMDVLGRGGDTLWLKYTGILLCLAFAILGIINAVKGERRPLPVIGGLFQFIK